MSNLGFFEGKGALESLVAGQNDNQFIGINVAYDYMTWKSESLTHPVTITKCADVVVPEYVELTLVNPSDNLTDLRSCLYQMILQMEIGDMVISNFPLGLLMDLETPHIMDGKIYFNLQFSSFFQTLIFCP